MRLLALTVDHIEHYLYSIVLRKGGRRKEKQKSKGKGEKRERYLDFLEIIDANSFNNDNIETLFVFDLHFNGSGDCRGIISFSDFRCEISKGNCIRKSQRKTRERNNI